MQASSQWLPRILGEVGGFHCSDDIGSREDVALDCVAWPGHSTCPGQAVITGEGRGMTLAVDDSRLALRATLVCSS